MDIFLRPAVRLIRSMHRVVQAERAVKKMASEVISHTKRVIRFRRKSDSGVRDAQETRHSQSAQMHDQDEPAPSDLNDEQDKLLEEVHNLMRNTLKNVNYQLTTLMTIAVFGVYMPILLLLSPVWIWLSWCTTAWIDRYGAGPQHSFGSAVATRVLVHYPWKLLCIMLHIGVFISASFVLYDLEFHVGPVVLFCALCMLESIVLVMFLGKQSTSTKVQTHTSDLAFEMNPMSERRTKNPPSAVKSTGNPLQQLNANWTSSNEERTHDKDYVVNDSI